MSSVTLACSSCHTSLRVGQTVCNQCGLIVSSQTSGAAGHTVPQTLLPAAPSSIICTSCGRPLRQGSVFCSGCGNAVSVFFSPLQPGQILAHGRYCVQNELSKGGMGAIYLATDRDAFDRLVVVKTILDYFDATDPQQVQSAQDRFLQEARTLSTLKHPAIPQIFSYFQEGSQNYIVMEYIEGRDLEQNLTHEDVTTGRTVAGHPYSHKDVVRWGVALCRVLEYLASRKPDPVLHLDIKPRNLLQDENSHHIRLVDFGTAKSRAVVPPNAGGHGQKSSIFGTAGYAPPEQYSGQSEPRSDVYALAATLYHLATDDDPGAHPFSFSKLPQLGAFGTVLEAALHQDVTFRSTATVFRRQLESILTPSARHPIQTPNGLDVTDEQELAIWCEGHWTLAAKWLYDKNKLPEQIERLWGKNKLASDIRGIVNKHASRDAGLDAMLSLLDPQGFGAEQPGISCDKQTLDYGTVAASARRSHALTLTNTGRRYVPAQLQLPTWMTTKNAAISLIPGDHFTFVLTADMQRVSIGGKLRGSVQILDGITLLLEVPVEVMVSRWHTLWRHYPGHMVLVVATLLCALAWTGNWAYWEGYKAWYYSTASRAVRVQQWDIAAEAIIQLQSVDSDYRSYLTFLTSYPNLKNSVFTMYAAGWQSGKVHNSKTLKPRGLRGKAPDIAPEIAFSPDERLLAVSMVSCAWRSDHRGIQLFQVSNAKVVQTIGDVCVANSLAFSPDGQFLAVAKHDMLELFQISKGNLLWHYKEKEKVYDDFLDIRFSPDSQFLAIASSNGTIKLVRLDDGTFVRKFEGHSGAVASIAFSPDGQMLASGSDDKTIKLWRVSDGALLRTLGEHDDKVLDIEFSPDGRILATSGEDARIKLWQVSNGTLLNMLMADRRSCYGEGRDSCSDSIYTIRDIAFSPDGETLAGGGDFEMLRLWRVSDGAVRQSLQGHETHVKHVAFSPNGQLLASYDEDGTIKFWRAQP